MTEHVWRPTPTDLDVKIYPVKNVLPSPCHYRISFSVSIKIETWIPRRNYYYYYLYRPKVDTSVVHIRVLTKPEGHRTSKIFPVWRSLRLGAFRVLVGETKTF